ncbi:MAG: hypothetical protein ISR65_17960 [Bacteriovoracaceae bacterium]|nr:hypothetical protein [Bacteriovoracaceae bacterium]
MTIIEYVKLLTLLGILTAMVALVSPLAYGVTVADVVFGADDKYPAQSKKMGQVVQLLRAEVAQLNGGYFPENRSTFDYLVEANVEGLEKYLNTPVEQMTGNVESSILALFTEGGPKTMPDKYADGLVDRDPGPGAD